MLRWYQGPKADETPDDVRQYQGQPGRKNRKH